ncbi:hypothetical protein V8G54_016851 [Vigna mungo]|uniref:ADP-ribosylation factor 1 n=1 Tax=Vigna mungo TaxID=3915 RepID=A0AAQ3NNT4_VIGMU
MPGKPLSFVCFLPLRFSLTAQFESAVSRFDSFELLPSFSDRLQMGEVVSTIPSSYSFLFYIYPNLNVSIGFNVETVQYNNIKFQVWDLGNNLCHLDSASSVYFGGQTSIRPYWRCYFPNTQAIIYVVDSSDVDRLVIAKEEFHAILERRGCATARYAEAVRVATKRDVVVARSIGFFSLIAGRDCTARRHCNRRRRESRGGGFGDRIEEELKGAVVLLFANKQDLPGALDDAAVTEALELHKIKNRQWAIFKTSAIKGEGLFEGLDW